MRMRLRGLDQAAALEIALEQEKCSQQGEAFGNGGGQPEFVRAAEEDRQGQTHRHKEQTAGQGDGQGCGWPLDSGEEASNDHIEAQEQEGPGEKPQGVNRVGQQGLMLSLDEDRRQRLGQSLAQAEGEEGAG